MIETLLRTITNRGIWKLIWLPHISTITLRSNEPLTYDTNFPLSHDSLLIRGFDHRYLCIPSSTSLLISTLFSFPWYVILCEPVTCLQANCMTFHREGPEYIYPSYGWTRPTLDPCVATNTFRTLNATIPQDVRLARAASSQHPARCKVHKKQSTIKASTPTMTIVFYSCNRSTYRHGSDTIVGFRSMENKNFLSHTNKQAKIYLLDCSNKSME